MPEVTSYERIIDAAHAHGLKVRPLRDDEAMIQCPVHTPDNNPSVHVTYRRADGCTLICDQHDSTDKGMVRQVLEELGLDWPALYDNPLGHHAARKRYERLWQTLRPASAGARRPDAKAERLHMPEPCAPLDPFVSDRFRAICHALDVEPKPGRLEAVCPVCGEVGALRVLYAPLQAATLMRCRGCEIGDEWARKLGEKVNAGAGLLSCNGHELMVYDTTAGVEYEYADGLTVSRTPGKRFRQSGHTKGTHPLWQADRAEPYAKQGAAVFMVEGEKDAATLWALGYPAVTAPGGGGSLSRVCDPASVRQTLTGARVIAIADRDVTGSRWRSQTADLLQGVAASVTFAHAAGSAHDATDAILSGSGFEITDATNTETRASTEDDEEEETEAPATLSPLLLPDCLRHMRDGDFWQAVPWLQWLHRDALASNIIPESLLGAVMSRANALYPPTVVLKVTPWDEPMSRNLDVALIGGPGSTKGKSLRRARLLLPRPVFNPMRELKPKTGEAVVSSFIEMQQATDPDGKSVKGEYEPRVITDRVQIVLPEVSALSAALNRQDSTMLETLLSGFSNEPIGGETRNRQTRVTLPPYSYGLHGIVGVQPKRSGAIFEHSADGFGGRFLFFTAFTDTLPDSRPDRPATRFPFDCERIPDNNGMDKVKALFEAGSREAMPDPGRGYPLTVMTFPKEAAEYADRQQRRGLTGQASELDSHRTELAAKLAALFHLMRQDEDNPYCVTSEDWQLGLYALAISDRARDYCMNEAATSRRRERMENAKDRRLAEAEAAADMERHEAMAPEKIIEYLGRHEADRREGGCTRKEIRNGIRPQYRPYVDTVLSDLEKAGRIRSTPPLQDHRSILWRLVR